MMKRHLLVLLLFPAIFCYSKTDSINASSSITDVTVFLEGAEITRTAKVSLSKGRRIIVVNDLPFGLDPQSLQVKVPKGCQLLTLKHKNRLPDLKEIVEKENAFRDKIKTYEIRAKEIQNKLKVYQLEEDILMSNSDLGKNRSINSIREAAVFYRERLSEVQQLKFQLVKRYDELVTKVEKENEDFRKYAHELPQAYGEVSLMVACETTISADFEFTYYLASAGWEPVYDFRVDDITDPLKIVYKANVFQSSGEDWNSVKLTLSNADPAQDHALPVMDKWIIEKSAKPAKVTTKPGNGVLEGIVLDEETLDGIPFANILIEKGDKMIMGTTTDFEGRFKIKPMPSGSFNVKVSYVGYKKIEKSLVISPDKHNFIELHLTSNAEVLDLVEVVEYKIPLIPEEKTSTGQTFTRESFQRLPSKSLSNVASSTPGVRSNYQPFKAPREVKQVNLVANSMETKVTSVEYAIEIPYTILSDGEDHKIHIKEVTAPVNYEYYCIPKMDDHAFLLAHLPEWHKLNLLSGHSNIYYEGTFIGSSYFDTEALEDTLQISLGRDRNILVERNINQGINDRRVLSNTIKHHLGYEISVRNNKTRPIKVIVEDQYPVTEKTYIEIDLVEDHGAEADASTGKLRWVLELEPMEQERVGFEYHLKYPKYVSVNAK